MLERGGVAHDVKEYPGVGHSFMNDWDVPIPLRFITGIAALAGIGYSETESEDAWKRILDFFDEHLR